MPLLDRRDFLTLAGAAAIASGSGAAWGGAGGGLVVATRFGRVRGRAESGIRIFTGIPYGSAERFAPPRPAPRWHDILDATRPAAIAPQPAGPTPRNGRM
ncbi:MAG: carboxylesterase family protein, partial [Sphingomonas sp.]|nr:carboxylesterase family protein [Sphingomonas sp.]